MTKLTLPAPREPAVDLRTGTFTRNWILYLQQSFERLGGSDAESITAITELVRQVLQDISDNEVERSFGAQPVAQKEDGIEWDSIPEKKEDAQEPNDYQAQIAELGKKISDLEKTIALQTDPSAANAEAVKKTKIVASAQVTSGTIAASQLIPWDTVNVQQGVKYDSASRRFYVPIDGNYLVTASLFKLNSAANVRVLVGVNTDAPTSASNGGQVFADGAQFTPLSIANIVTLKAGDYVTFLLSSGSLYSAAGDRFNYCTLQLIG